MGYLPYHVVSRISSINSMRMWPSNPQNGREKTRLGMTSPIFRRSPLRRCGGFWTCEGWAISPASAWWGCGNVGARGVRGCGVQGWGKVAVFIIYLYIYILYYMFIYRLLTYHRDAICGNFWTWKVRQIIVRTDEVIHLGDHSCKKHFCVCTLCFLMHTFLFTCAKNLYLSPPHLIQSTLLLSDRI